MNGSAVRGTAALGALLIVLRYYYASKRRMPSKLVTDFSHVAYKVGEETRDHVVDEFDVIVVGGGTQ